MEAATHPFTCKCPSPWAKSLQPPGPAQHPQGYLGEGSLPGQQCLLASRRQEGRFCFLVWQGVPHWLFTCVSTAWVSDKVGLTELLGPPGSWAGQADFPVLAVLCSHRPCCTLSSALVGSHLTPQHAAATRGSWVWNVRSGEGRVRLRKRRFGKYTRLPGAWSEQDGNGKQGSPSPFSRSRCSCSLQSPPRLHCFSKAAAGLSSLSPDQQLRTLHGTGVSFFFFLKPVLMSE